MRTFWSVVAIQKTKPQVLGHAPPIVVVGLFGLLVGKSVFGMVSRVGGVAVSGSGPSWKVLLSYEYEIRAAGYKRVMKGEDLADALRTSWVDPVVKERFFTTPLCWEAIERSKRRPDSQQEYPAKAPRTGSCDNRKGKGKRQRKQGRGLCRVQCGRETYLLCLQQTESEVYDGQQVQILPRMWAL